MIGITRVCRNWSTPPSSSQGPGMTRGERTLPLLSVHQERLVLADALDRALLLPSRDDLLGAHRAVPGEGEAGGEEQDVAAGSRLVGEEVRDIEVARPAIRIGALAAKLAEVEQRDDVEDRQQLRVQEVDVAEDGVVIAQHLRPRDRELDVFLVFLRRGGDAEHRVAAALARAFDADVMMVAGAEMVDGAAGDLLAVEPLDEVDVAGAFLLPQVPGIVPEQQLRGVLHRSPRSSLSVRR